MIAPSERNIKNEFAANHIASVAMTTSPPGFQIEPVKGCAEGEPFLIVRSLKNKDGIQKGYNLEVGDILKLGRIEFRVQEGRTTASGPAARIADGEDDVEYLEFFDDTEANTRAVGDLKKICRICLGDECDQGDNALISPCGCKGSCEYIHWKCFCQWVGSKVTTKKNGAATSYLWKKVECEICNQPVPRRIRSNRRQEMEAFSVQRPSGAYMILESLTKEKKAAKVIHVLDMNSSEPIKMGRGHQCNVRVSDISVSRLHAMLTVDSGKFLLLDNNSKFGTLVLLGQPLRICEEKVAIQIGRTVITFVLKPRTPTLSNPKIQRAISNQTNHTEPEPSRYRSPEIGSQTKALWGTTVDLAVNPEYLISNRDEGQYRLIDDETPLNEYSRPTRLSAAPVSYPESYERQQQALWSTQMTNYDPSQMNFTNHVISSRGSVQVQALNNNYLQYITREGRPAMGHPQSLSPNMRFPGQYN
eukprot:TRINITY_DN2646_c0_g1_i1.p1 TRINITY_DN2646_c0_g1~~TRINITY_DN2646_c0_g1_i1.p1  ORF type:complete len:474 (-),score=81.94 TRINITY_DN2646_c0_g1_i1:170-1591(-)